MDKKDDKRDEMLDAAKAMARVKAFDAELDAALDAAYEDFERTIHESAAKGGADPKTNVMSNTLLIGYRAGLLRGAERMMNLMRQKGIDWLVK
jgi:hypothetical protein